MAGVTLYVDLEALQQLADQLSQIHQALADVNQDLTAYGPALGSKRVASQLDDFVSGWKDGRKKIESNLNTLLGKVQGVAQTYQQQEGALAKAAQSSGSSGTAMLGGHGAR